MSWFRAKLLTLLADGQVLRRSGNTLVGAEISTLTPAGNWLPGTTAAYDLGITGTRWRDLFLSRNATVGGTLGVTGAATLGATLGVTGAVTLSSTLGVTGAATLGSTLAVTGAATLSSTLGVTGAATLGSTLAVTGAATLSSTLGVTGNTTLGGTLGVTGDITAGGGFRQTVTGWSLDPVLAGDNATPASSTPVLCGMVGVQAAHVAKRAGSITGLSFHLDTDPAGSSIIAAVSINGTVQAATAVTLAAGATRHAYGVFAKDAVPFVAGDLLRVVIRTGSGWSATSSALAADVEIES